MESDSGGGATPSPTLFLDGVGEVEIAITGDGISWKPVNVTDQETIACCLGLEHPSESKSEVKFGNIYAVEAIEMGLLSDFSTNARALFSCASYEMYRFVVHGSRMSKTCKTPWVLSAYTFGHHDFQTCQTWVEYISACINVQASRPKNLLVFVHPLCGKRNGCGTWKIVTPLFSRAKVTTKVIVTDKAGHAFEMLASATDRELSCFDGIVAVGGDGLFSEVLNGLLSSRHKAPLPPHPVELDSDRNIQTNKHRGDNNEKAAPDLSHSLSEVSNKDDCNEPLLLNTDRINLSDGPPDAGSPNRDQEALLSFPNNWFRLGIIPAGSTDAIVISTTGLRDPVTSALQIILGKKIRLDIAQVVRWKNTPSSEDLPSVRYAASFVGYGFYGDVIKESEKYRWMGPARYDFAGTKVFLEHRSYEAEIAFLEVERMTAENRSLEGVEASQNTVCQKDCTVCNQSASSSNCSANGSTSSPGGFIENSKWQRSKGHYLSVGGAVISCRNERAPDGLVADAHLADGFLHLILIKDCPHPSYLWHLIQLTKKGSKPLNFGFVEHHKTPLFMFSASHDASIWNVDGELFQACQVSVQVCRGLVNLFASGPDV